MTTLVLFHHVLGVTPGFLRFAEALRAEGVDVSTPDLFGGEVFPDVESGLAHLATMGDGAIEARAEAAVQAVEGSLVVAGISLGAAAAQHVMQHHSKVNGALLFSAFLDPDQLGGGWPGKETHIFASRRDEFFVADGDLEAARSWAERHPELHVHLYDRGGHLFMEDGHPDHDSMASARAIVDARAALAEIRDHS